MISIRALILGGLSLVAAASASFATDRIVFLRSAPAESTLYIANADGSEEKPLTQPGSMNYNPAWSARGDWIAFTSDRAGSADLFRMHSDGTGQERLTDDPGFDDQAAFSPDAKRIAFVSTLRRAGQICGSSILPPAKSPVSLRAMAGTSVLHGRRMANG
jgi:TolB protein